TYYCARIDDYVPF
nr:immunoglobulin heavy chain junction region [Mus musculus]